MLFHGFKKIIFLLVLFFVFQIQSTFAQSWPNGSFSSGDLTSWNPVTTYGGGVQCLPSVSVVTTGNPAINTVAGQLNDTYGANTYACQLFSGEGDSYNTITGVNGDWAQVSQSNTIPNVNSSLSFWFAGVFEDYHYNAAVTEGPSSLTEDAYLQINVIVGGSTVAALTYNWSNNLAQIVVNGAVTENGINTPCPLDYYDDDEIFQWGYVPWTNYIINLSNYKGQTATLQATMYDCHLGGHYGAAYLDNTAWVATQASQVTLTKVNNPSGFAPAGMPITYTLSYSNPAGFAVAGVEVDDTIPAGTTLVPGSVTSSPSEPITSLVGNDLIWTINSLAAGATGTLTFAVIPTNCSETITNTAHESDLDAGNITSNSVVNAVATCTPTPTSTGTPTNTSTNTITDTPTITYTPTNTDTPTITNTPTLTPTVTNTFTPTSTFTATPSPTPTCVTYVWPDPYNPNTAVGGTLRFSCMNGATLEIFTISGELVQTITDSSPGQPCGANELPAWGTYYCWNGRNKMGFPVATGIYFYVVQNGNQTMQRGKFLIVSGS